MSRELKNQRATLISQARALIDVAEKESRDLTAEEQTQYTGLLASIDNLKARIDRADQVATLEADLEEVEPRRSNSTPQGFNLNHRTKLGDTELKATAHYIRTGDVRALGGARAFASDTGAVPATNGFSGEGLFAASNDTDMNIGTVADGGYAVPTGHYRGIIAKQDELRLSERLGVMPIPGVGTTVNVPIDNGTANVFVSTSEAGNTDRDAPVLSQAQMTLVFYTKKVQLSYQLLRDEDSRLMDFLEDYVGRAAGRTHNSLLMTEVLANGTSVALGTAAAATVGDPETLWGNMKESYGDEAAFVMKRATEAAYRKLTGNPFAYQATPAGVQRQLSGYPVYNSEFAAAIGAGNKSVVFGNFAYVGLRNPDSMGFLRDPYGAANTGQVNLYYYMSVVYKVLIAEAVLYGTHPTA